jgi:hypothetical protein
MQPSNPSISRENPPHPANEAGFKLGHYLDLVWTCWGEVWGFGEREWGAPRVHFVKGRWNDGEAGGRFRKEKADRSRKSGPRFPVVWLEDVLEGELNLP